MPIASRCLVAVIVSLVLASCSEPTSLPSETRTNQSTTLASPPLPAELAALLDGLPGLARTADGGGEPRNPGYWITWSRCGEGTQADVADENGGRAAGWVLLDDLLDDPGVAVGDHVLTSCEDAVGLLEVVDGDGINDALAHKLGAELLGAQLNLFVGAETCPALEELIVAGHVALASVGFDAAATIPDSRMPPSAADIVLLLEAYNQGLLCT